MNSLTCLFYLSLKARDAKKGIKMGNVQDSFKKRRMGAGEGGVRKIFSTGLSRVRIFEPKYHRIIEIYIRANVLTTSRNKFSKMFSL